MYHSNSPIDHALNRLRMDVPKEILNLVFFPTEEHRTIDATNLNARIREHVIDPIVMSDMNQSGGKAIELDVKPSWMEKISPRITMIKVPKQMTQNRTIIDCLHSTFGMNATNNLESGIARQGNTNLNNARRIFAAVQNVPYVSTALVEVKGDNILEVRDHTSVPTRCKMLVRCTYDINFTDLSPRYWDYFSELVAFAVKAYCYTNAIVPMDRSVLQGGVEMGRLSSKIEEYSDANETYRDQIKERWKRILIQNDPIMKRRVNTMVTNP